MRLLENLPVIEYRFGMDWMKVRDIFVHLRVLEHLRDNPQFLTTVSLDHADRADVVAHRLYKDSNLFWTLYLVNDIVDPADWVMSDSQLSKFVNWKYENPNKLADDGQQTLRAEQWLLKKKPFKTIISGDVETIKPQKLSHYDIEESLNAQKKIIRAIRPEYMTAFLKDVEDKLRQYNE